MKHLVHITEREIHHKKSIAATPTTTTFEPARLRVLLNTNNNKTRQTKSTTQPTPQLTARSTPAVPRVEQSTVAKHKKIKKRHKTMMNTTTLAHNTRYRTQKDKTPPARMTRARTRITIRENKKQKGQASKVETTISQFENNVQQALVVMDTETDKFLNYRQLMRNPKYKIIGVRHLQMNSGDSQMELEDALKPRPTQSNSP